MTDHPNFSTPHNTAFKELGAIKAGQHWSAFDVSMSAAEQGRATVLVTTIWNYYLDSESKIPAVHRDRQSGDLWYKLAGMPKSRDSGTKKAHRHRLEIALEDGIPIVGFLKDLDSGSAASDVTFDCTMLARDIRRPGALWVQLRPRCTREFDVQDFDIRAVATLEYLLPVADETVLSGKELRSTSQPSEGPYLHGDRRTWEVVLDGLVELGGSASMADIKRAVLAKIPRFESGNFFPDLSMLAVNSPSRGQYGVNARPRRTDSGSEYDKIFREGHGRETIYKLYDVGLHGIWELYQPLSGEKLKVRQIEEPSTSDLRLAIRKAEEEGVFDPTGIEDARFKMLSSIVRRRGQSDFRAALRDAYGDQCCITGCNFVDVLEAAHIHPYQGDQTNVVSNGLLLRADIHTLFDLFLLRIDPTSLRVHISPRLAGSEYASLEGRRIATPMNPCKGAKPKGTRGACKVLHLVLDRIAGYQRHDAGDLKPSVCYDAPPRGEATITSPRSAAGRSSPWCHPPGAP